MAPSNFGYSLLRGAAAHFVRNLGTSIGAVITIFLSLFIIGLFILGSAMVNSVIGTVEQQVTINAFISDEATDEQIEAFRSKLESWENVKSVDFKTKDDALEEYMGNISNNADATLAALDGENPLPRSFTIEMNDPSEVQDMAERIKADEDFREIVDDDNPDEDNVEADVNASVIYGQEEVGRLFQVTTYIRIGAVVLVGLLTFIAFIFIKQHYSPVHHRAPSRDRHHASGGCFQQLHSRAVHYGGRHPGAAGFAAGHRRARAHP